MAQVSPVIWYASSVAWTAVTAWSTALSATAGMLRRQSATPTVGNERVFVCIIAGTTLVSEPTWTVTKGAKTAEAAGPTWQECTGQPAVNGDLTNTPLSSQQRSQAVSLGLIIQNNAGTYYFICSTAGTCGAGEPSYTLTAGVTTADNTCTWTCLGAVGGFSAFGAPHSRLSSAASWATSISTSSPASPDTIYVKSDHAETSSAAISINCGYRFICVSGSNSPPVSGDFTTGATVTTTGATGMTISNGNNLVGYFRGIAFNVGTGSNSPALAVANGISTAVFDSCAFNMVSTGVSATITVGAATGEVLLTNTTFQFSGSNTNLNVQFVGNVIWRDTASAVSIAAGSWMASLFYNGSGSMLIEDVDLSAFSGTQLVNQANGSGTTLQLLRCKINSAVAVANAGTGAIGRAVDAINCDSGGVTYRHEHWAREGRHVTDAAIVVTGGASDGTTTFAWKLTTTTLSTWSNPFRALPIQIWNSVVTPTDVTVTIEGMFNGAALPNNDDIWLEVRYLGNATSTLGSLTTETKTNLIASNTALSASTALWGSAAAARQNTHVYAVGDCIGVSSAGSVVRVFVCTTGATSSGSLPAGYASAVDGGSVTDGTAVFRAAMRFSLAVTLSPKVQSAGYLNCYVKAAKLSSTFWVSPKPTLS